MVTQVDSRICCLSDRFANSANGAIKNLLAVDWLVIVGMPCEKHCFVTAAVENDYFKEFLTQIS